MRRPRRGACWPPAAFWPSRCYGCARGSTSCPGPGGSQECSRPLLLTALELLGGMRSEAVGEHGGPPSAPLAASAASSATVHATPHAERRDCCTPPACQGAPAAPADEHDAAMMAPSPSIMSTPRHKNAHTALPLAQPQGGSCFAARPHRCARAESPTACPASRGCNSYSLGVC